MVAIVTAREAEQYQLIPYILRCFGLSRWLKLRCRKEQISPLRHHLQRTLFFHQAFLKSENVHFIELPFLANSLHMGFCRFAPTIKFDQENMVSLL